MNPNPTDPADATPEAEAARHDDDARDAGADADTDADAGSGYTLMEVLIALTILASSMTILLGTQSSAVQRGSMANDMTVATLLARAKMLEIESDADANGFNEDVTNDSGDFSREGYAHFRWEVEIEPVEMDEGASEALLSQANTQLFGEGEDGGGGTFTGNAAFAAYLPMVVGMVPDLINRFGEKVRKVTMVISWDFRGGEQKLTLVQYITDMNADDRQDPAATVGGALQGTGLGGPALPGAPGFKP